MTPLKDPDVIRGAAVTAIGWGGLTVQQFAETVDLLTSVANLLLALGGIIFLACRVRHMRREINRNKD
jgi:hypothetical protein